MLEDLADLVKYEPGVYMANDVTRFGLNGINIRGTGGNRVLTQIDGVQTSEQFDFRLLGIAQTGIDPDMLRSAEIVRGGELGAVRQRRPRRRPLARHQGPGRSARRGPLPCRRQDDLGRPGRTT